MNFIMTLEDQIDFVDKLIVRQEEKHQRVHGMAAKMGRSIELRKLKCVRDSLAAMTEFRILSQRLAEVDPPAMTPEERKAHDKWLDDLNARLQAESSEDSGGNTD